MVLEKIENWLFSRSYFKICYNDFMPTLDWIGKSKVINHHLDVPFKVLEKQYTYENGNVESENRVSENRIIHGDNLEALKALLPEYEGKIKCIYIDPPYNTGNENWVYNDNVNDPRIKKWLGEVVGQEGEDLSRHDKWLCMMYPRLKLLQKLLSDDGAIFISIDDNEQANLKLICDEIFGQQNFVDRLTVIVKPEGRRYGAFAKTHENIFVYAKNIDLVGFNEIEVEGKDYKYFDEVGGFNLKGLRNRNVRAFNSTNRPNLRYPFYVDIKNPDKNGLYSVCVNKKDDWQEVWASTVDGLESVWRWGKEKADKQSLDLCAYKGNDDEIRIFQKERKLTEIPKTVWFNKEFHSIVGTRENKSLFGDVVFDFPKPLALIEQILTIGTDEDSIILDSFAGSGTTAHAVLNMNKKDGGNRKFILVEMMDYAQTITAERVKRVINGYGKVVSTGSTTTLEHEGTGGDFAFYELGEPLLVDGLLNENVDVENIREYIWWTETHKKMVVSIDSTTEDNEYFLGKNNEVGYWFYYKKNEVTSLDYEFLRTMKTKSEQYIIYADVCLLSEEFCKEKNIIFKKIPRDIQKF